jgi:hypothetical protein
MSLEHSPVREGRKGRALEPLAFTVDTFCATHEISRSHVYKEWREGRGPRFYMEGVQRRISAEAAAEYRAVKQSQQDGTN